MAFRIDLHRRSGLRDCRPRASREPQLGLPPRTSRPALLAAVNCVGPGEDDAMTDDMEPRISEGFTPLGEIWYKVQWVSRSGKRPEPYHWMFKSRRKAERWVANRQKHLLRVLTNIV